MPRVLLIDAEQERVRILQLCLAGLGCRVTAVASVKEGLAVIRNGELKHDLVMAGEVVEEAGFKGLQAAFVEIGQTPPAIRLLAKLDKSNPEQFFGWIRGFQDCLESPLDITRVQESVQRALNLAWASDPARLIRFEQMVGSSERMQGVFRAMLKAANNDGPVLFEGEFGVGKRLAAITIQQHSARRHRAVRIIRCRDCSSSDPKETWRWPAISGLESRPETLAQLLSASAGDSFYFQDIDALPKRLQAELADMLGDGADRETSGTNLGVRVHASATRSLNHAIEQGEFLAELYYRLSVNRIEIPSLRERPFEIRELAHFFLAPGFQIAGSAEDALVGYRWPGNVAELRNVITAAAHRCESQRIELQDLPTELLAGKHRTTSSRPPMSSEREGRTRPS